MSTTFDIRLKRNQDLLDLTLLKVTKDYLDTKEEKIYHYSLIVREA